MTSPASPFSTFSLRKLSSWWLSGNSQPVRSLQDNHHDENENDDEIDDEGDGGDDE